MKIFKNVLCGVVIGLANIIPGVSGGTMMVSMGVYDTLIDCINKLFINFRYCVKTLWPYALGMLAGILGLAKLIMFLLTKFSLQTNLAFIGLIFGGFPMILKNMEGEKKGIAGALAFTMAFLLVITLQIAGKGTGGDVVLSFSLWQIMTLFGMGVIASAAMVVPGVSGSMMLMLLGYYNPIVETISRLADAIIQFHLSEITMSCCILLPFGIGVALGILAVAKLIEMLLQRYTGATYSAILGLVAASPVSILMTMNLSGITASSVVIGLAMLSLGFVSSYKLGEK